MNFIKLIKKARKRGQQTVSDKS